MDVRDARDAAERVINKRKDRLRGYNRKKSPADCCGRELNYHSLTARPVRAILWGIAGKQMKTRIFSVGILLAALGVMLVGGRQMDGIESLKRQESDCGKDDQKTENGIVGYETAVDAQEREEAESTDVQQSTDDACMEEPEDTETPEIEKDGNYWMLKIQAEATIDYGGETVPVRHSDEVITAEYTDDLSLLECADETDHYYAYQDGKVYYRQYHEDSFEESGLWANYNPVPGTEKEIVCIDQAGVKTELFKDEGYGAFYLLGGRFYMKEVGNVYSVDMSGQSRIDYGPGEIVAVDEMEHIIVLELHDEELRVDFYVLDYDTGVCKSLSSQGTVRDETGSPLDFCAYQDGYVYLQKYKNPERTTELYAVSIEGEWEKIITLTPDAEHYYADFIVHMEIYGDRLFFLYGGYDGSANVYQGGRITTVKKDGSDYRSIKGPGDSEAYLADYFYLGQDAGKILVYYPNMYIVDRGNAVYQDYYVTVWGIDAGTFAPAEISADIIYERDFYIDEDNNVLIMPDMTGRVLKVVEHLDTFMDAAPDSTGGDDLYTDFSHFYYKDGYLYFEAEYSVWSKEDCIGWRDGYRRVQTRLYRLKLGKDRAQKAELLYSY